MYAATATEKQEWMAHIKKCIDDLIRKSGKKAADSYAAVWVKTNRKNLSKKKAAVRLALQISKH